jgi:hypothetical protein
LIKVTAGGRVLETAELNALLIGHMTKKIADPHDKESDCVDELSSLLFPRSDSAVLPRTGYRPDDLAIGNNLHELWIERPVLAGSNRTLARCEAA